LDAFFLSTLLVAIAEIGDKTQLLAIVLAAKFRRPWLVLAGILAATLANHALAATAGYFVSGLLEGRWFGVVVGLAFLAMAGWALIPDKLEEEGAPAPRGLGVFTATTMAFFLVEMGDKTQIATVALAARFHDIATVAAGTTLGMMLANTPAVFLGEAATRIAPLKWVRIAAAVIFAGLGLWTLVVSLMRFSAP
jgi:putative Ca2+/H+ antiporter (TMEM165/GDT1 family)